MITVLFVVSTFPSHTNPSVGSFNVRAAKQLSEFCSLRVIRLRSWIPGRKIIRQYNYDDFNVTEIFLPYIPIKIPGFFLATITGIYKYLSYFIIKNIALEYDIIHSVGIDLPGIVGSYLAKKINKLHIAQVVGTDVNCRIGLIKKFPGVRGWDKSINYLVGNSQSLVIEFRKHYPNFPEAKTNVIYRGIDVRDFAYSEPKNINSEISFLYLGGISEANALIHGRNFKGVLTLIEAWDMLYKDYRFPISSIKLFIGGPNTKSSSYLLKAIKKIHGNHSIEILGSLTTEGVKTYMRESAVIIIPSMAEGLPNVAVEAAAIGRPVIASRVGGIPELVIHNETGLLFDAGNVTELTKCMKQIVDNPMLIKQFGINARERVVAYFNSQQFAQEYITLYES